MNFDPLCQQIGYFFNDTELLYQAFTHKSFISEHPIEDRKDNERLEFLGDAVIGLVISDLLMEQFPDLPEGGLSQLRAGLVSETGLSKIAQELELGQYLFLGRGEELTGGRQKKSILSNTLEALMAAIYVDSRPEGLAPVQKVVQRLFAKEIPAEASAFLPNNFKAELQEFVQKSLQTTPSYKLANVSGPDHQKQFEVIAMIAGKAYGHGSGNTKKQAEQLAAKETLAALGILESPSDLPLSQES